MTNKKKIGLVPLLYREYNYGGILQLYALQYSLKKLGYEVDIIQFNNDERIRTARLSKTKKALTAIKRMIYRLIHTDEKASLTAAINNRKIKIDAFRKKYYSPIINENNVNLYDYSSFVCGSDQIWNPNWARRRCFLEFVPDEINKVIYGASLGVEKLEDYDKADYKKRIERLEHVSVREYSAKAILDEIVNRKDIEVVVDPTLLLYPEDWDVICEDNFFEGKRYIFTYFLGDYSQNKEMIEKFAISKDLIIVNIPFASTERMDYEDFGDEKIYDASPGEFLALIRYAEYIFTDSFHACVFSTLFKKEFYVFERDGKKSMMGRIITLQKHFNLPNRILSDHDLSTQEAIDYSENRSNQTKLRDKSIKYLMESLKNE